MEFAVEFLIVMFLELWESWQKLFDGIWRARKVI